MNYTIGTRGSKLALAQTQQVADRLKREYPEDDFTLRIIQTAGDRDVHTPLDKMKDKGIFVKEIEEQILRGELSMAVHSMKDMPSELPQGLCFADAWAYEDPRDVIITKNHIPFEELKQGAILATGSKRRIALIKKFYPQFHTIGIRGNIDTRLTKMKKEGYDGILLAAAGLKRLQKEDEITTYLDPTIFIPACTQGILALEIREDNTRLKAMLDHFADQQAIRRVQAERAFLKGVDGGCHIAVGAYLESKESECTLHALLEDTTTHTLLFGKKTGKQSEAKKLGEQLARELLEGRACHG